jgi:hypothetical protein
MNRQNNQSSGKGQSLNEGFQGISKLNPVNSGGTGTKGLDGISEIAPKSQSDSQASSQGDKK